MSYLFIFCSSFLISLIFNPIHNNFTALLNTEYIILYYVYTISLISFLFYKLYKISNQFKVSKIKWLLYLDTICFIIGSFSNYKLESYHFVNTIHVSFSLIATILTIIIIKMLNYQAIINSYENSLTLDRYFDFGCLILAMLAIIFGSITGVLELYFLLIISINMYYLEKSFLH